MEKGNLQTFYICSEKNIVEMKRSYILMEI
jgi:hypothetical protein